MSIVPKYFLNNPNEQKSKFGGRLIDVFVLSDELELVDHCLCHLLSKEIDCKVHWYKSGNKSIVCVLDHHVDLAIKFGKQIIIDNFTGMSAQYICNGVETPVLDEYIPIVIFKTASLDELNDFISKAAVPLIVKVNSKGENCVLQNKPVDPITDVGTSTKKHCTTFINI